MVIKSNHAAGETAMFSANREWGSKCIKLLMAKLATPAVGSMYLQIWVVDSISVSDLSLLILA